METAFIAGIIGFIGGGVLMFFMKDKIVSVDQSLHTKVDAITGQIVNVGQQLANHVTQQVALIAPKPTSPPAQ